MSRDVLTLKIKLSGLIPKLNSTVNDHNSIDETDNNTEDETNNSTGNAIDDSTIDLDNDDTVAGVQDPRERSRLTSKIKYYQEDYLMLSDYILLTVS